MRIEPIFVQIEEHIKDKISEEVDIKIFFRVYTQIYAVVHDKSCCGDMRDMMEIKFKKWHF